MSIIKVQEYLKEDGSSPLAKSKQLTTIIEIRGSYYGTN